MKKPQSKETAYYREQKAMHAETQALKDAAKAAKYARALVLLAEGVGVREVAARLGISDHTVRDVRQAARKRASAEAKP